MNKQNKIKINPLIIKNGIASGGNVEVEQNNDWRDLFILKFGHCGGDKKREVERENILIFIENLLKEQIDRVNKEVIGEDIEFGLYADETEDLRGKNRLKQEQRQKLDLIKGDMKL